VTFDPDFKVATFSEVEYLKNGTKLLEQTNRKPIPNTWNGTVFGDLD